jgi:hypothetical protein
MENFNIILESINMPSYDQGLRSYDLCKLGVLLKFQFWTECDVCTNLGFEPISKGKLGEH